MISTVACIGFTDPSTLASIVREDGEPFHALSGTRRWVDSSGASVLLDRASQIGRPAFDTTVHTPYERLVALESGLAQVQLAPVDGVAPEPLTVLPTARYTVGWAPAGQVALTAMGVDTEFFATAEDFFDSPRSAMPGCDTEPPPEVRQFGLPWPPPMEIASFLPRGEGATAVLSGTVQHADVRTNSRTRHEFLVARVATLFGEIDLCSPVPVEGAPSPGSVAVATVELHATFPPHGEPKDTSSRVTNARGAGNADGAGDRVRTTFRNAPETAPAPKRESLVPDAQTSLAPGHVLGDDGVVRLESDAAGAEAPSRADTAPEQNSPQPPPTRRSWRARLGRS